MKKNILAELKYMTPVSIFESDNCKPGDIVNVKIISFNQEKIYLVS